MKIFVSFERERTMMMKMFHIIYIYIYIYIYPHTHVTQIPSRNQCKYFSILNKLIQWMGNMDVEREKKTNFKIEIFF